MEEWNFLRYPSLYSFENIRDICTFYREMNIEPIESEEKVLADLKVKT